MHSIWTTFILLSFLWMQQYESVQSSTFESFWSSSNSIREAVRRAMATRLPALFSHTQLQNDSSRFASDENATTKICSDLDNMALVSIDSLENHKQQAKYNRIDFLEEDEKTSLWDFLSSAFRMSMEAKNELNSSLDRTRSLLSSSGGGSSQWKSSTTAFIASRATATLERVGKRLIDELSKETSTVDSTHEVMDTFTSLTPKDPTASATIIRNEEYKERLEGSTGNSISIKDKAQNNSSNQILSDGKEQLGSVLHHNQSSIQTQALDQSNLGFFWDNTTLSTNWGHHGLRAFRKRAARITGIHGFFSGKKRGLSSHSEPNIMLRDQDLDENDLNIIRRRISAIQIARERVADKVAVDEKRFEKKLKGSEPIQTSLGVSLPKFRQFFGSHRQSQIYQKGTPGSYESKSENSHGFTNQSEQTDDTLGRDVERSTQSIEELQRGERLKEIDRLILEGQRRVLLLQCQKDLLLQQLNPLFNYTSTESTFGDLGNISAPIPRIFNFPSPQLVREYIGELIETRRLMKLNHTHLWRYESDEDDADDIGDDLLTPSADAQKLYAQPSDYEAMIHEQNSKGRRTPNGTPMGGGSWLLRQSIGKGGSFGEKLGETVETAAYRGICSAVMSFLARLIAQLHGLNVLMHSDVRLFMQNSPDLPPVSRKQVFDVETYAQETLRRVIRKNSKKRKIYNRNNRSSGEGNFMQRNAVVETLLSNCQISAPLLKLFPLAWQRAMLGNCVTLTLAIISGTFTFLNNFLKKYQRRLGMN